MSTNNLVQQNHEVTLDDALALAKGHHQTGNLVLAERTYRDILRTVPQHFPTTQFLGALLFQCGYFEESQKYFSEALEAEPEDIRCVNNYAGVLLQFGAFEEAIEYLDRAIALAPEYTDAISNKAYALWQLKRFAEAEQTAQDLLKIEPDNINGLNSLGIALSKQFRFEEAIDAWKKALEVESENAMCLSNLGNALREMSRMPEAHEKCKKAYDIDPEDPTVLNNYANIIRDGGNVEEAIKVYRQATDIQPDYPEAHTNLAVALNDEGLYREAAVAARYAIAFKSGVSEAYSALSTAQSNLGELAQAHTAAQSAVKYSKDDDAYPYINLAEVLEALDQYDDAEAAIKEALHRQPESARAYIKLSEIRQYMGHFPEAHSAIDRALELSPQMPKGLVRKGTILFHQQKMDEALQFIDQALKLSPKWAGALTQKAEILASLGRFEEAEEVANTMIESTANSPAAYNILAGFKEYESEEDPIFKAMLKFEDRIDTFGVQVESAYYLSLAHVYHSLGEYDKGFEYLKKGNDARKKIISGERSLERQVAAVASIKETYTPEFFDGVKGYGLDTDEPIFIMGMPRSGTTLTEQIISSHPDVTPGGELTFITSVNASYPHEALEDLKAAGEEYIAQAQDFIGEDRAKYFTDKMPGNYMLIGYIKAILPNAKIIYCRRNPMDNCLSCYQQNFFMGHYWSYDLEDCAEFYMKHDKAMDHWREVLPGGFLEVQYEDTVTNLEEQARRMIDYLGLEWNDACLEPHKLKRAVMTASRAQVTKPVYTTSVEKWRKYEKGLQPLVRKLAPELALPEEKSKGKKAPKKSAKKSAKKKS